METTNEVNFFKKSKVQKHKIKVEIKENNKANHQKWNTSNHFENHPFDDEWKGTQDLSFKASLNVKKPSCKAKDRGKVN